jgi:hypothetical protein
MQILSKIKFEIFIKSIKSINCKVEDVLKRFKTFCLRFCTQDIPSDVKQCYQLKK